MYLIFPLSKKFGYWRGYLAHALLIFSCSFLMGSATSSSTASSMAILLLAMWLKLLDFSPPMVAPKSSLPIVLAFDCRLLFQKSERLLFGCLFLDYVVAFEKENLINPRPPAWDRTSLCNNDILKRSTREFSRFVLLLISKGILIRSWDLLEFLWSPSRSWMSGCCSALSLAMSSAWPLVSSSKPWTSERKAGHSSLPCKVSTRQHMYDLFKTLYCSDTGFWAPSFMQFPEAVKYQTLVGGKACQAAERLRCVEPIIQSCDKSFDGGMKEAAYGGIATCYVSLKNIIEVVEKCTPSWQICVKDLDFRVCFKFLRGNCHADWWCSSSVWPWPYICSLAGRRECLNVRRGQQSKEDWDVICACSWS